MQLTRPQKALPERTRILRPYADPEAPWARRARWLVPLVVAALCFPYGFFFGLTAPYLIVPMMIPMALLLALVIWALPEAPSPPTRSMNALLFVFFLGLAWPNYLALALPGLPWITMLRLFGTPMALLLLVSLSVSKTFRSDLARARRATPVLWGLLAAFCVLQILTLPLSNEPAASLQKVIVYQTIWTAAFVVSAYAFLTPGRAMRYAYILWGMAVFLCILGVLEVREGHVLWRDHIPKFLKVDEAQMRALQGFSRRALGVPRITGTSSTPLGFAELLALISPFCLHFLIQARKVFVRIAAALSIVLIYYIILKTDSRLGVVGLIVAFLFYLFVWSFQRWRTRKTDLIAPTALFSYPAVFCAVVAATFFVGRLRRAVWGGGAEQASNDAREVQISRGIPKVIANPFGNGAGQAADTLGFFSGSSLTIDTYYLAIALEYGVLGFIVYYGMIIFGIVAGVRSSSEIRPEDSDELKLLLPLTSSLVGFILIKSVFSQQDNHPLVFVILGMISALVYRQRSSNTLTEAHEAGAEKGVVRQLGRRGSLR